MDTLLLKDAQESFDSLRGKTRIFIDEYIRTLQVDTTFGTFPSRPLAKMTNLIHILTLARITGRLPDDVILRDINGNSVTITEYSNLEWYLTIIARWANTLHNARARLLNLAQESIKIAEDEEVPIEQRQEAADNILTYEEQARERFDYCVELERRPTL